MKMYTPDFPYDDTPWQGSLYQNPNFNVFKHAYSSYVQTVPTLERALTERNQYDDKPFFDATTIIDVAKKLDITPLGYLTKVYMVNTIQLSLSLQKQVIRPVGLMNPMPSLINMMALCYHF